MSQSFQPLVINIMTANFMAHFRNVQKDEAAKSIENRTDLAKFGKLEFFVKLSAKGKDKKVFS